MNFMKMIYHDLGNIQMKYSNGIIYNPKTLKLKKKEEHFKLSIKPLVY